MLFQDYFYHPFTQSFIFYEKNVKNQLDTAIMELQKRLAPTQVTVKEISELEYITKLLPDTKDKLKVNEIASNEVSLNLKAVSTDFSIDFRQDGIIGNLKLIFGQLLKDLDVVIDISHCPPFLDLYIYHYLLAINSEASNIDLIAWKDSSNSPIHFPTLFLDGTSQIILDFISNHYNSIQQLQDKYSEIKKIEKVSQPFISKYTSLLIKKRLIEERWEDGKKHYYLTDLGTVFSHSTTSPYITTGEMTPLSIPAIIQQLRENADTPNLKNVMELIESRDLVENDYVQIIQAKYPNKDIQKQLFQIALSKFPQSLELQVAYAQFLYLNNDISSSFNLCQEILKKKPEEPRIWKLLGKMTFEK